ncbi:N-acetyldiaminopimelate deacetylase [Nonomuraea coxensis DSM 45129]|uniref:N-acetyldiaminopimelate deacetylase n=1 Tax=Nonomuraea coxensis DSM 45129 TaxID=1122611 RepID=A0ABX8UBK7_9ACTN|nr:M20 family metallopeptidase [Nonomuraea coxensis]QYC44214.1 N-acetyldiaminopimelate deacetylase [Nonomuraea coxensis DSM 45129]
MSTPLAARLLPALEKELPAAGELRRRLHAGPDLSGEEGPTRDLVLAELPGDETRLVAGTGALVRVGGPGRAVGVRAELDALAVTERTGVVWASGVPGRMHACGHDVHLAALVALARAVAATDGAVPLVAVLQPREETYPSGARDIAGSPLLAEQELIAVIGAHVQPTLPAGLVAATPGTVNAAADEFTVVVRGRGGHAAYPHLTSDPVLALAHVIVGLQRVVSRDVDPTSSAVLGVSTLAAGSAPNVVPDSASASGTLRSLSDPVRELVHTRLREVAELVARAHGCEATVTITHGEPVLRNDPALATLAGAHLTALGLEPARPMCSFGADDFSYLSAVLPGLMMFVGVDDGSGARLHGSDFLPGDDAVRDVALAMLAGYLAAADVENGPPAPSPGRTRSP